MAAAWVHRLPPEDILQELENGLDFLANSYPDVPLRQRSLQATFEHSWNLITTQEQVTLSQLSTFPGRFDRQAAQIIADASPSMLTALCDKSLLEQTLVDHTTGRVQYQIHELIQQYVTEKSKLNPAQIERTRDRFCSFYMDFLNQRDTQVMSAEVRREATQEVKTEFFNIRLAVDWAIEGGRVSELGHSLNILMFYYEINGPFQEAEQLFSRISAWFEGIRNAGNAGEEIERSFGRSVAYHAWYLMRLAQYRASIDQFKRALKICRLCSDLEGAGLIVNSLGVIAIIQGSFNEAKDYLQEAVQILPVIQLLISGWSVGQSVIDLFSKATCTRQPNW
jgi:tetratricopeptide (TPR) repeat protein